MGGNKRLLNIHEQNFAELAAYQANTTVFQANTNASLKNLETRIGQLALNIQKQSKDLVPSESGKDSRECMTVLLRSGRELEGRRVEKKDTEEENYAEIREEFSSTVHKLQRKRKQQGCCQSNKWKKEEVKAYEPHVPFPQRLQKANLEEEFFRFLNMFKKIEINIPFSKAST